MIYWFSGTFPRKFQYQLSPFRKFRNFWLNGKRPILNVSLHVGVGLGFIIGSSSSSPATTISQTPLIYLVYYLSNIYRWNNCNWANDAPIKEVEEIEILVNTRTKPLLVSSKWLQNQGTRRLCLYRFSLILACFWLPFTPARLSSYKRIETINLWS